MTRRWQTNAQDRLSAKYRAVHESLKHNTPCDHLPPLTVDPSKHDRHAAESEHWRKYAERVRVGT